MANLERLRPSTREILTIGHEIFTRIQQMKKHGRKRTSENQQIKIKGHRLLTKIARVIYIDDLEYAEAKFVLNKLEYIDKDKFILPLDIGDVEFRKGAANSIVYCEREIITLDEKSIEYASHCMYRYILERIFPVDHIDIDCGINDGVCFRFKYYGP